MGIHTTTGGHVLGRHARHDPRSRAYVAHAPAVKPRTTYWPSSAPTLDQGQVGACVGNAMADWLNTDYGRYSGRRGQLPYLTEVDALRLYSDATHLDGQPGSYPPTDTGSDGNSVAKAARAEGLITSWRHSLGGITQLIQVLQVTPVIAGTNWTDGMEDPTADGRVRPTGPVEGGHEYLIAGVDITLRRIWIRNSWGDSWGVPAPWPDATGRGYAWIGWADYDRLLAAQGDVTVPIP